ncbi:MAG: nucleotidyltransferase domain-containing protein [Bacteroidales bacterium]|jgi:predicted nucleotidyltransferase|nr:nucleotidyltransferase domain-containing protein [Bacteroidales bacterium]
MNTVLRKKQRPETSLTRLKPQSVAKFENKIPFIRSLILDSVDKADIQKIYLFGSYANGKPKETSDIDICVVIKDTADRPKTYLKIAMNLTDNAISPCDLVVCRESDFYGSNNPNGIEHTIMEEGRILYAC